MLKNKKINILVIIILSLISVSAQWGNINQNNSKEVNISLLPPATDGNISLEKAINNRRSIREYSDKGLTLENISQLAWASQGITGEQMPFRAAPSAGALYPLEIYFSITQTDGVKDGIYKYQVEQHSLKLVNEGDYREKLSEYGFGQKALKDAPVTIIITGVYERTTRRYGSRAEMYVHMEAGHVGQNIYLQCEALSLATVAIGSFDEDKLKNIIGEIKNNETPLYMFPVGIAD
ncbi:MAG: SagB/ThcOx family dehydrogenase [Candidatus Muiribacteriota bacterium]